MLSFIRSLEYSKQFIDDQVYYLMEFAVMDFISFTGGNTKSTYQRTKALEFLTSLQDLKPLIKKFSDNEFRRSVLFPYLKLTKQNRRWVITLAIGKEFYFYQYPFSFPSSFISYQTNYEMQVKLQIIKCMSTNSLEKVFHAIDFLDQFNVSTQKQANIKKLIAESFHHLQHHNRIKNKFKLVTKSGKVQETNKLVPLKIGQSKSIRFYEVL